jgi:hypothetical protein
VCILIACCVILCCCAVLGMAVQVGVCWRSGWICVGAAPHRCLHGAGCTTNARDQLNEPTVRHGIRLRAPDVGAAIGGTGSITRGCGTMPGMLLHVMRRCSLFVVFKTLFTIGFQVSMIGGAFVMQGIVRMGASLNTLFSVSRSWVRRSASTLCSSARGGLRRFLTRSARSCLSKGCPFVVSHNSVGTVLWSRIYGKRASWEHNNYLICNDLLPGPGRMHPRLGTPMIRACHHLHIRLPCIPVVQGNKGSIVWPIEYFIC